MSSTVTLEEAPFDIDDKIDQFFIDSDKIKTEKSIITYDESENKLYSNSSEYVLRFERDNIEDSKQLNKFIKKCESMIRTCPEYSDWTDYIRNVLEMTECQITGELHHQTKSDVHHHPYCLYSIVKAVIMKRIAMEAPFSSIDVCKEVMDMHYKMRAPFIVLMKSIHEKFHNGFINLPMELVQGDYQYFIKHYTQFLDEEDLNPILDRLKINWDNCGYSQMKYRWSDKE